jgi:hypothetical protein
MQRLQIQPFLGLDGHKSHPRTLHRLGDRFRIQKVTLVGLHVRLYVLRRHQPYLMSLLAQSSSEKMRSTTRFHANQLHLQIRGEG